MEKEEEGRQALLKTMSRTERRKERITSLKATAFGGSINSNKHQHPQQSAAMTAASLVEDGVLFRPGPTAVRLRTAKQMQLEVARRRRGGGGSGGEDDQQEFFSSGSGDENGNKTGGKGGAGGGGGGGRGAGGLTSSSTTTGCLTVKRRGYSCDGAGGQAEGRGVVLEVNRTGGGGRRRGGRGGGHRRAASGEGRPNMIFTPSLVPVGLDSVRARPMTLGNAEGAGASSVRWGGETALSAGDASLGGEEGEGAEVSRDTRTV